MAKTKRTRQSTEREAEHPDRSENPNEQDRDPANAPSLASFHLAGSEVLDVTGSLGAARRNMHDAIRAAASEIEGPFLEIEIDTPDETDTDEDIDQDGLHLIGGPVAILRDEPDEPAPATQTPSAETRAELEQEGGWEWPDEKTPVYRSTAERFGTGR